MNVKVAVNTPASYFWRKLNHIHRCRLRCHRFRSFFGKKKRYEKRKTSSCQNKVQRQLEANKILARSFRAETWRATRSPHVIRLHMDGKTSTAHARQNRGIVVNAVARQHAARCVLRCRDYISHKPMGFGTRPPKYPRYLLQVANTAASRPSVLFNSSGSWCALLCSYKKYTTNKHFIKVPWINQWCLKHNHVLCI